MRATPLTVLALLLASCGSQDRDRERRPAPTTPTANAQDSKPIDKPVPGAQPAAPAPAPAPGASATAAPDPGTTQRAAIMDAMRPAIERRLGGPVEFVVQRAAVQDGWALVIADPQRPGGGQIDPRRHFPREVVDFMDGVTVNAILRFSGGAWTLVDHAIGPTDVWYCGVEGPPRSLTGC